MQETTPQAAPAAPSPATPAATFEVLAVPLSKKCLQEFRRDAGWSTHTAAATAKSAAGKVQWVTLEQGKKRIGIARLELAPPEFCYLSDMIIAAAYRGKGLGHEFVRHIERYCIQRSIRRLLLQPVASTRRFYESLYFIPDPYVSGFLKKELSPFRKKPLAP